VKAIRCYLLIVIVLSVFCESRADERPRNSEARSVTIEGALDKQGSYILAIGENLANLLGKAHPSFNARLDRVLIIHGSGKSMTCSTINFKNLAKSEKDFELKSGDRVFVFSESL